MNCQQQQAEEVQERKRGKHSDIGARAADFLDPKRLIGGRETGVEDEEGFVGRAEVSGQEVWEDCAGGVERGGVGVILSVPFILHFGQLLGGVLGAER